MKNAPKSIDANAIKFDKELFDVVIRKKEDIDIRKLVKFYE